jgi:acyl-CoA thioesterase-1
MIRIVFPFFAVLYALIFPRELCAAAPAKLELRGQRIVFLGDSITDGNSYPLMIKQALSEAKIELPVLINAGIGGDTAAGMLKRLERDVFVHKPTLVTLSAGINDVMHKVSPADYETSVTAIAEQLKAKNIPLLILTTSVIAPKHGDADKRLEAFNTTLRALAAKHELRLADVNTLMNTTRSAGGEEILEEDGIHPNYAGQRLLARAVLDALSYADVALPKTFSPEMMPGVVRKWQVRKMPEKTPELDAATVASLSPDDSWATIRLPEKDALPHWWQDQERQRGFVMSLEKTLGKAPVYHAVATMGVPKAGKVFVNTGANVRAVWVNGTRIYKFEGAYTGWHAGRDRIPVTLNAGTNTIVLETGPQFFLSITEDNTW